MPPNPINPLEAVKKTGCSGSEKFKIKAPSAAIAHLDYLRF